jgi:hypothetical protein
MATVMPTTQGYRAPGPYDEDYRSIARREQMAQILQQQALQPIDVGAYQGIQAPISPLSGIAKILQGYFAGQQMDKADEGRQDLLYKSENADRALVGLPPIERTRQVRLMNEVWKSVEVAEKLRLADLPIAKYIDVDLNPDKRYKSNEVLRSAVGLVEGMGYTVRYKSLGALVTHAADALVK